MAINAFLADFLARALAVGALPIGGEILEFGESNVAPHNDILDLFRIIEPQVPAARFDEALRQLEDSKRSITHYRQDAGPARAFYHAVFAPRFYVSLDLGIAPRRLCVDLNGPVVIQRLFDCVINNGTCQHIFDQSNFYRLMHDITRPGGVILHWTPVIGWVNHGLYTIQPGFFFDLAAANDYAIELIGLMNDNVFFPLSDGEGYREALEQYPALSQAVIGVVFKKNLDQAFRAPIQGTFQGGSPEQHILARTPRRYARDSRPNLALNKPALQSSTGRASWHDEPALDAIGATNGMITGYYSFCTNTQLEPWWQVDLGAPVPIQEVVVFNRIDTFPRGADLSVNLQILLSQDGEHWSRVFERRDEAPFGGADGNPLRVLIYGRVARFVRLSLPGLGTLCLDEVEIY
jgi:hypothetical protein